MSDLHCELVEFRADAAVGKAPDGMLRGMVTLALPGVYTVQTWDGQRFTEYVPPETLADPEYVASLAMLPVTLEHPAPIPEVTPQNARQVTVGALGTATVRADGAIEAPITVYDAAAIQAARTTHRQNSLGYRPTYDLTPGTAPNGQQYDRKQVKRVANHTALVPQGVHGSRAMVRADSAGPRINIRPEYHAAQDGEQTPTLGEPPAIRSDSQHEGKPMAQIRLGNLSLDVADASTATAIQTHCDKQAAEIEALRGKATRADSADVERDALKAEIATLKTAHAAEVAQVRADAAEGIRARVKLEAKVEAICGKDYKCDGKDDNQLRADACAALKVVIPEDRRADAGYLAAALDFALSNRKSTATAADVLANAMTHRGDTAQEPVAYDSNRALARQWG